MLLVPAGCAPGDRTAPATAVAADASSTPSPAAAVSASLPATSAAVEATTGGKTSRTPKIASWLAKVDEIIASQKPYDLVMSGWFTAEQAAQIKKQNPDAIILAGISVNWVWDNQDWMAFLTYIASYGREVPFTVKEDMYLHQPDGSRVAFGWASGEWGHEEIYAMDPRNPDWVNLITAFYKNVLGQPQHDGIIVDMVLEVSWCPAAISDEAWVAATGAIFRQLIALNTENKPVVFNAGRDLNDIDVYRDYMDGYLMENFMGAQLKAAFDDGLQAPGDDLMVIYAVDTDDTGIQDLNKMRLGLVLSLMYDNAYFTYDFGPRDHGQAWWFPEYDVELGRPLGDYYRQGDAYYRDFEKGTIVASPYTDIAVVFDEEHADITSGETALTFNVSKGDGRIFLDSR